MKKILKLLGLLLLIAAALALFMREALLERLVIRQIDKTLSRVDDRLLSDGKLHVILCGTAAALPDADRAGPCTAVIANGEFWLIDVGPGSWRNLDQMNLPLGRLSGVLLTHFHSDHIGELGEAATQSWIAGRKQPLPVYGPVGVEDVVAGFRLAYSHDTQYRVAHHGEDYMSRAAREMIAQPPLAPAGIEAVPVLERNGLRISAFRVQHEPVDAALGYRFEFGGRVVVISGDTIKSDSVLHNAQKADLLLHEALSGDMTDRAAARARVTGKERVGKLASDVRDYHTMPQETAEIAAGAQVKQLVLTHVFPPLPNAVARHMFMSGTRAAYDGDIVLGEDGMRFDLSPLENQQP